MTIVLGTTTNWTAVGSPPDKTFTNDGDHVVFLIGARNSIDSAPTVTLGTYDSVAIPDEEQIANPRTSLSMGQLYKVGAGAATLVVGGTATVAWGATSVSGFSSVVFDSHSNSDWGSPTNLDAPVKTLPGGIAFGIQTGQSGGGALPSGWTALWAETYTRAYYKLTDGSDVQPTAASSGLHSVIGVVSYGPKRGGGGKFFFSKMQDFYDELRRGLISPELLQKKYKEVMI